MATGSLPCFLRLSSGVAIREKRERKSKRAFSLSKGGRAQLGAQTYPHSTCIYTVYIQTRLQWALTLVSSWFKLTGSVEPSTKHNQYYLCAISGFSALILPLLLLSPTSLQQ